jgi:hypothetical protein
MFARLLGESFARNPRRKVLTAAALVIGMAVATATLTIALEVGDRLAREFRSLGANLLVTPESDTLPVEIGGVDYRPVDEGAYLNEADLGKLKTIFWRQRIWIRPTRRSLTSLQLSARGTSTTCLSRTERNSRRASASRIPGGKFKDSGFKTVGTNAL